MNKNNILSSVLAAALIFSGCGAESESSSVDESSKEAVSKTTASSKSSETAMVDSSAIEPDEGADLNDYKTISEAYLSGETSGLDRLQRDILQAAEDILLSTVNDEMTLIEKELAIHDRLSEEIHYDESSLSVLGGHSEHAADLYGGLVEHNAICTGYAVSFALMMEMIGVEAIVVEGTNSEGNAHAWDQVRLDGEWYCVDLTWDDLDPETGSVYVKHQYFNCTGDYFYEHYHRWTMKDYPKATGTDLAYGRQFFATADSLEAVDAMLESAVSRGCGDICLIPEGDIAFDLSSKKYERNDIFYDIMDLIFDRMLYTYNYEPVKTDKGWALMISFRDE